MGNEISAIGQNAALLWPAQQNGKLDFNIKPPFESSIVLCEDAIVAGTSHVKGIDDIVAGLAFPASAQLVRDAGNMHDEWAIKVLVNDKRIGFVPCACNEMLARLMDGGKKLEARLIAVEKCGSWNKIHMEVSLVD